MWSPPASNLLRFALARGRAADDFAARCLRAGVRVRAVGGGFVRAATHLDVSARDAALAAETMVAVARGLAAPG